MLVQSDGNQRPTELVIGDQVHTYNYALGKSKDKFFKLLEQFLNYRIQLEYYNSEGELIKITTHLIKSVCKNDIGVPALNLD